MSYNLVVMKTFGNELRRRRKEKRWTQDDLHIKSGVSASYISTLERAQPHSQTGATLRAEPDKVEKLATALNWDVSDALELAGYARKDLVTFNIDLDDNVRVSMLHGAGMNEDDQQEFTVAFNAAYRVAKQIIADKKEGTN